MSSFQDWRVDSETEGKYLAPPFTRPEDFEQMLAAKRKRFYNKDLTSNSYDGDPDNSDKTMLMIIMSKLMIDTWISKKQMELEVESQN